MVMLGMYQFRRPHQHKSAVHTAIEVAIDLSSHLEILRGFDSFLVARSLNFTFSKFR